MNSFFSFLARRVLACFIAVAMLLSCQRQEKTSGIGEEYEGVEFDDPGAAAEYEFKILKDKNGVIPANIRKQEIQQAHGIYARQLAEAKPASAEYFQEGPVNIGGRTRCVEYDVRYNGSTNRVIMAGGVTGGIYKSTDDGATWIRKSPTSAIYNVTSLAQDTRPGHQDTWYYSTGEYLGSNEHHSAPYQADGIFKSTDNGETWAKLPASNTGIYENFDRREDLIWRVIVDKQNGDIYMAATASIFRSTNGGESWQAVLIGSDPSFNRYQSTDIIMTESGQFYAAVSGYAKGDIDGVWTSSTGDAGSWTRIAGDGAGGAPEGWYAEGEYGRIVLAPAPAHPGVIYAYVQTFQNICPSLSSLSKARLFRWDNASGAWTNLSGNLPDCTGWGPDIDMQGGYNMMIHVKPDDPNVVLLGAQNLYRSTDGFTSPVNVRQIGGYGGFTVGNLHPDIHWITFKPGHPSALICATDGGMARTNNITDSLVSWENINYRYTTTQFYFVAIDPVKGSNKVIGGTQDNGTLGNVNGTGPYFDIISGGDGISVGYSNEKDGEVYQYVSVQGGSIIRRSNSTGSGAGITPFDGTVQTSSFYTLFKLDNDNTEYIYFTRSHRMWRTASASTTWSMDWTEMPGINSILPPLVDYSALTTTRGPYDPSKSSLFIGLDNGSVYRLDDPIHADPLTVPTNITGPGFETWGNISSIAVNPRNDDTILVTRSNYGGLSIWWTGNANSDSPTWVNVERNLTLPSIRSSVIAITANGVEYFVGTSVGLFHSNNPLTSDWTQESPEGIGNAVVTSLAIRPSDNFLLAGTYGNGLWSTKLSSASLPLELLEFNGRLQYDNVLLNWKTTSELSTRGFEIQRSFDGMNFSAIGFVASAQNNNVIKDYQFMDMDPASANNYYRLKIIDQDGLYKISKIVLVKKAGSDQIITLTNPFHSQIEVRFSKLSQGKVEAYLYDMSGRLLGMEQMSNSLHYTLRFGNILRYSNSGIYVLRIIAEGEKFTFRVVKQ